MALLKGVTVHGMEMNHLSCQMVIVRGMNESYILLYDCNYLGPSVGCTVRMVMLLDVKEHEFMERKWIIYPVI